ncbi:MAG TPA: BBP7 family outer membrane beta-barrel protein [Gemmataceae bacterium]|nr:BBP7 family outer membrane beta-barrel protein [Gemmataceae bacterium]
MKKAFLVTWAFLLCGTGLALAQAPPAVPTPPAENAPPAPAPPQSTETAAPAPAPQLPEVDRRPWNPSLKQGSEWPYPEPPHSWLSGLCPDVGLVEFWLRADYLFWALKGSPLPALVTTSPPNSRGILDLPGTSVLIGNSDVNRGGFSGGHFAGGVWLDDYQLFGLEGSYFFLAERSTNQAAASSGAAGSPTLGRPFFNVLSNMQDAELLAIPGQQAAAIAVNLTTSLQGAEATGVVGVSCTDDYRLEMLIGFRYLQLDDKLGIGQEIAFVPNAPVSAGSRITQFDEFDVRNRYYAGQLGARAETCFHGWLLGLAGKLALGGNEERASIAGASTFMPASGVPLVSSGGVLALPSNSGRFVHGRFAVVPEVDVQLGYQLGRHVRLFAGYTFLYWSDVVRAGNQIDTSVNATQVPVVRPAGPLTGPARPAFSFHETDFWAQGGTFGLEFRY